MKVLIVGAGGQLGRALQTGLTRHEIIALPHARLDVTRFEATREAVTAHRPDVVINASAYTDVDGAESDHAGAYKLNAVAPRNLSVASHELGAPLVHVSTDYVFDGQSDRPYHEFDRTNPLSIYGKSKLAGESAVAAHNPRHYIVRTSWLYHTEGENFPKAMLAQSKRAEVRVVGDQYGSPTYAPHLAAAIAKLMETGAYGTYHIAGSGAASRFEMTRRLYQLFGIGTVALPAATAEFPRPAPRPRYSVMTTVQEPEILLPPWEDGLAEFASASA
ncbi:MAG TPA: dTDP-4-dehydrorhamnose reductase [Blastocatellia bacterium]|jgi:dTDP-4-dehydrorhamnose reductase|nr:dTDP-4-dehydrorhamnose reductase [Blastocatellia bacterium]